VEEEEEALVLQVRTVKVLFFGGLVRLVAEKVNSATLENRDLMRRQVGVLARHFQHPADLPKVCPTCDREAARSFVRCQHHQLAPPDFQQRLLSIKARRAQARASAGITARELRAAARGVPAFVLSGGCSLRSSGTRVECRLHFYLDAVR
jgi:hypothetical protein